MRQLILDLLPESPPTLDNFVPGGNAETLAALTAWLAGTSAETSFCLWGEAGSGRSHLLQASGFAYVDAAGRTYNPGFTEAGKATHMWKFSALDYQAGIVCGSYQTDATRLTVAAALKAARSAPAKPKQ